MSTHHLHGCGLACFGVADEVDGAEVAASHFLQLLVFLHHRLYVYSLLKDAE